MTYVCKAIIPLAIAASAAASTPSATVSAIPLNFEPNRGQASSEAAFVARGTGYYLTLDRSGSRMLLRRSGKTAEVRTSLVGANPHSALAGAEPLPGHSAYFRGKDASRWITNLPNFAQVKAENVYPGIDVVYYGNQSRLEYDFVVALKADPNQIRLRFDGVSKIRRDKNGDLVLATAAGEITQSRPLVYQTLAGVRKTVEADFRITSSGQVRFALGRYDRSLPLVIDPVLVYSTFLGGGDTDAGNSIAADGAANTYMTGVTFSTPDGDADVLVRKISADGTTFLYTADLGGSNDDYGNAIALDVNGYAFIGGRTSSTDFPTANAFQDQNFGSTNAYVLRLDPAGSSLIFSTYVGGGNDDRGYGVAVDPQGSVYLTGLATSDDFPTNDGAFQRTRRGGADAFVIKFAYNGAAIYSTFIGGASDDIGNGIAVDANGNAYIAGQTVSDSFPQANAPYQHSRHGGVEGFVIEVSADGSTLVFSTFIGGAGDDACNGVAVDLSGNVYVVGSTSSGTDFSFPNRSYDTTHNGGNSDIFVAKYSASGQSLAWASFLGSHGGDYGTAVTTDPNGNVYVAGDTDSDQYPVTGDAIQRNRAGGVDAVLSVLDTNGQNLVYSTFFGGSSDDSPAGVALDQYYEVYLTGSTGSGNFPITQGAVQSAPGGGDIDAFIAKISVYGSGIPGTSPSASPAPISVASGPSSTVSAFGRGMVAPQTEGRFTRGARRRSRAIAPEGLSRFGRNSGAVSTR